MRVQSSCKVNLLLNILGKRADGFHELETLIYPINLWDELILEIDQQDLVASFDPSPVGEKGRPSMPLIQLTCSEPTLSVDSTNLVRRAATAFFRVFHSRAQVRIHLEKRIPLAAGLGGGSGNAATTLLGLNRLFNNPLSLEQLVQLAAELGSDVPFFLQDKPALATGRGEKIQSFDFFPALKGAAFLLIHPGFGISTAWAYQQLSRFPAALNGKRGRAERLIELLQKEKLTAATGEFYNSLEAPALKKFPILGLYQEFLREHGAMATLMSGSGSTTFAITANETMGRQIETEFKSKFGSCWTAVVPVNN